MRDKRTLEMNLIALFIAIIVAMAFIPQVGFIAYGGVAITTLHIPVIIGAIHGGRKFGIILGIAFGVFSLIVAYVMPRGPGDFIFQNPVIAIVPRFLFGLVTFYIFIGFRKLVSHQTASIALTFIFAALAHSVFTLSFMVLFADQIETTFGQLYQFLLGLVSVNGLLETVGAALIGTPIVKRLLASETLSLEQN